MSLLVCAVAAVATDVDYAWRSEAKLVVNLLKRYNGVS